MNQQVVNLCSLTFFESIYSPLAKLCGAISLRIHPNYGWLRSSHLRDLKICCTSSLSFDSILVYSSSPNWILLPERSHITNINIIPTGFPKSHEHWPLLASCIMLFQFPRLCPTILKTKHGWNKKAGTGLNNICFLYIYISIKSKCSQNTHIITYIYIYIYLYIYTYIYIHIYTYVYVCIYIY